MPIRSMAPFWLLCNSDNLRILYSTIDFGLSCNDLWLDTLFDYEYNDILNVNSSEIVPLETKYGLLTKMDELAAKKEV
jgi:hypothetical protein